MEDNRENRLFLALMGAAIGITGIVAYHESVQWIFYTCTFLSIMQWMLCMFTGELQNWAYPFLTACLLSGYYITGAFADFLFYGICLYYATALLYIGLLRHVPHLLFMVVPIVSMVAYFLHYEQVFMVTATFCTVHFLIAHFSGKTPYYAMDDFLLCVVFGIALMANKETNSLYTTRFIKGILWAGAAYHIMGILHAFYHAYIKGE